MGNKRNKCCCDCLLAEDNFDRADSSNLGWRWHEASGNAEIQTNELVVVTPGVIATRVCHPGKARYGSFRALFRCTDLAGGKVYKIRCGHPTASPYEIWVECTGSPGSGIVKISVHGDEIEFWEYDWVNGETFADIHVCYAPGLHLSAAWDNHSAVGFEPGEVITCIDGTAAAGSCFTVGGIPLGNFSFLTGEFDNFFYYVHEMEMDACPGCSCSCIEDNELYCPPKNLYLNLNSTAYCSGITGSYLMEQRTAGYDETDAVTVPALGPKWPEKGQWITQVTCPHTVNAYTLTFILTCKIAGTSYPKWELRCIISGTSSTSFGFDPFHADTIIHRGCPPAQPYSEAYSRGSCDPFFLSFPNIIEAACSNIGNIDSCCDVYEDEGGGQGPATIEVNITG